MTGSIEQALTGFVPSVLPEIILGVVATSALVDTVLIAAGLPGLLGRRG